MPPHDGVIGGEIEILSGERDAVSPADAKRAHDVRLAIARRITQQPHSAPWSRDRDQQIACVEVGEERRYRDTRSGGDGDHARHDAEQQKSTDPLVRQKVAGLWIGEQALQLNGYRSLTKILRGGAPGPEGSTSKLFWSQLDQELAHVATEVIGPYSQIAHGSTWAPDDGQWEFYELLARGSGIRAGTSEILRSILAERVLGLPKD